MPRVGEIRPRVLGAVSPPRARWSRATNASDKALTAVASAPKPPGKPHIGIAALHVPWSNPSLSGRRQPVGRRSTSSLLVVVWDRSNHFGSPHKVAGLEPSVRNNVAKVIHPRHLRNFGG